MNRHLEGIDTSLLVMAMLKMLRAGCVVGTLLGLWWVFG